MKRSERLAHVKSWRASKLTRPAYCKKHDLKYGTFMSWFKLEQDLSTGTGKFVALTSKSEVSGVIDILFPNGIQVHYSGDLTQDLIKGLKDA